MLLVYTTSEKPVILQANKTSLQKNKQTNKQTTSTDIPFSVFFVAVEQVFTNPFVGNTIFVLFVIFFGVCFTS